jgi:hypothetical protein
VAIEIALDITRLHAAAWLTLLNLIIRRVLLPMPNSLPKQASMPLTL